MHTVNILNHLVENHLVLTYALIFLITIIEGEIVTISAGILVLLGALNFWLVAIIIFCGGMVKTFSGYFIGKFLYQKWGDHKFLKYIEKRILSVMPHFKKHPFWSIFISKFIFANHLVIIFAGYKKINFKKYLQAEILSTLFWVPGLMIIGYFFSYAALKVSEDIWRFSVIVLVLFILFILFDRLIRWLYVLFEEFHHNNEE